MSAIERIRRYSDRLAQISAGLFVIVWLSIAAAPCAIAMSLGEVDDHDCPHCPPRPCHEIEPDDCDAPDSIDAPRAVEASLVLAPPPTAQVEATFDQNHHHDGETARRPPARAGPRAHLLHVQFNE